MGERGGGPPRSVGQLCDHLVGQVPVHLLSSQDPQDTLVPPRPEIQTHFVSGQNRTIRGRVQAAGFSASRRGYVLTFDSAEKVLRRADCVHKSLVNAQGNRISTHKRGFFSRIYLCGSWLNLTRNLNTT